MERPKVSNHILCVDPVSRIQTVNTGISGLGKEKRALQAYLKLWRKAAALDQGVRLFPENQLIDLQK